MPNWKKVIVSGSDASLNSLNVSNGITGSLFGTASYAISASFALTASYVNPLNQIVQITGSLGISGSTGTLFSANVDTIIFTGSAAISGTLNVTNGITGSLLGTASFSQTASYWSGSINNALSASFASTASFVANAQTASFVNNAVSSSYALTASFALNAGGGGGGSTSPIPYIHPTTITGSISVPDNHNGLLMSPVSISGSITIGSGSSLLTIGPITGSSNGSISSSFASTSSYSNNILGATNYIAKFTGGNTLSSSIMYENNNGIGVNDTSPTHRFQVSGDSFIYNSSNTLNLSKYSLIGALTTTVTGSETNQYANTGIYGALGYSATTGTFTTNNKSFVSAVFGQFSKSGGGNISGNVSSYAAGINLSGAGNVTTIAGFRAYAPLQSFGLPSFTGTLTNYVGLLIDDITGTTDVGSRITNKYGIYQTGTSDKNYLAGSTTINNVLQLGQQHPLPSGADGQLAVSASNLYFFSGSAWNKISFA
jgi:hypothetical protein